jgi:RNA polymerase sigma-70 factor (ECF subfamily)
MAEWPRLKAYLGRRIGAQEAEDVAQEAFLRVMGAADVQSLSGLLYSAARHLVIDGKRKSWRQHVAEDEGVMNEAIADTAPSPEEAVHWRLELERVKLMLEQMSSKRRDVFLLRVVEGLSYAEIAVRLGISVTAVEKRLLGAFQACASWRQGPKRKRRITIS